MLFIDFIIPGLSITMDGLLMLISMIWSLGDLQRLLTSLDLLVFTVGSIDFN